ncbi:MAG TPA: roadblock/LC7 domain-containing protein [Thermomicrobiaceae bacterium]|nr:roadblock/LC7 domain-containing protein [Thermomicrobiaceae bacterium]
MNMEDALLGLLEYREVLGAVVTTTDGLVIATAGVDGDDAEVAAAAGSALAKVLAHSQEREGQLAMRSGEIHLVMSDDLMLVTLTERDVPADRLRAVMQGALEQVGRALQTSEQPA